MNDRLYSVIEDVIVRKHCFEICSDDVYTYSVVEVTFGIPIERITEIRVRRYQVGETNDIIYADTVDIKDNFFDINEKSNGIYISTDKLGYGKSTKSTKYYLSVCALYRDKTENICHSGYTDTISVVTPDANVYDKIFKEE